MYTAADLRATDFELDLFTLPNGVYTYTLTTNSRLVGKGKLLKQ